jgi:hypothetical protein
VTKTSTLDEIQIINCELDVMINQQITFHPDILDKFELFSHHSTNKHRVVNDFVSILKGLCEIE